MGVEREVEEGEECRGGMREGEVEAGVAGGVGEAPGERVWELEVIVDGMASTISTLTRQRRPRTHPTSNWRRRQGRTQSNARPVTLLLHPLPYSSS